VSATFSVIFSLRTEAYTSVLSAHLSRMYSVPVSGRAAFEAAVCVGVSGNSTGSGRKKSQFSMSIA